MDTPDFFLGARLGAARTKAGISLEKAAKDTRIRVQRLREIEADDFSGFTHPTYARLFLMDYAEYLGVPLDEVRSMLPDRAGSAGGGFEYIEALSRNPNSPVVPARRKPVSPLRWIFVLMGLVALLVVAYFVWFTMQRIERVARSTPSAVSFGSPSPSPSPEPTPDPTPEPTPPTEPPTDTVWPTPVPSPEPWTLQ